jgi:hypothetical protein
MFPGGGEWNCRSLRSGMTKARAVTFVENYQIGWKEKR